MKLSDRHPIFKARPGGAVDNPLDWALRILENPRSPQEWNVFARAILARRDNYYRLPGAWIVPPPTARDQAPPRHSETETRGAWGGYSDGPPDGPPEGEPGPEGGN